MSRAILSCSRTLMPGGAADGKRGEQKMDCCSKSWTKVKKNEQVDTYLFALIKSNNSMSMCKYKLHFLYNGISFG